jgi:hypothetical protein
MGYRQGLEGSQAFPPSAIWILRKN